MHKTLIILPGLDGSSQHPVFKQKGIFEEEEEGAQEPLSGAEVRIEPSADAPEPPEDDEVEEDPPILPPGVGTSQPLIKTPKEKRVPGACLFTTFVPLQLVAHTNEGSSCGKPVIVYDNKSCNSVKSGTPKTLLTITYSEFPLGF